MNQRTARVIAHILEPKAPDSYLYWGFFDAIFEQKEYAESYVMESLARKMLAEDPELKKEFEQMKTNNPDFIISGQFSSGFTVKHLIGIRKRMFILLGKFMTEK
jgi:hypothetical protein